MITNTSVITIGRHRLDGKVVLAPMSGVTDHGFRLEAERFGAAMVVSEMIAADQLAAGDEEARLRAEGAGVRLHVVQLAGCTAQAMAEGARVAEASGADVIDINMGCPAKKVVNGWSGSALMRDLDHAQGLIEAVRAAVSVPVTLKMRLGWDHTSLNAAELARRAEDCGLSLVTVHGRTRQQFYKGAADWRAVRAVKASTNLPVLVNGDIADMAGAIAALTQSGADGVMIGRASLGRPWLVGAMSRALSGIPDISHSPRDYGQSAARHYASVIEAFGVDQGVRHARKHVAAYFDEAMRLGADISPQMRREALVSCLPETVRRALEAAFAQLPQAA